MACAPANETLCQSRSIDIVWFLYGPFLAVVTIGGLVGNCLVIAVTAKGRVTSTSVLLLTLASADIVYLISFYLVFIPIRIDDYYPTVPAIVQFMLGTTAQHQFLEPLYHYCKSLSVWTVVFITCERFVAVMKPLKASSILTVRRGVIRVLVAFVLLTTFWSLRTQVWDRWNVCSKCWGPMILSVMGGLYTRFNLIHGYNVYFPFMVDYALPMSILFVLNIMIIAVLAEARLKRQQFTKGPVNDESKMLFLVIIVFMILETPRVVRYMMIDWRSMTVNIIDVFGPINSSVNFIIYALFGRRFRNDLKRLLGCSTAKAAAAPVTTDMSVTQ